MKIFIPGYYRDFRCVAADCPDSCCKEWAVDVDPISAARYRALPGQLGDRLRSFLKDEDQGSIMSLVDGRCPMWRQDGLCEIQAQLGHDALCKTCREYPRLRHDYGYFVELGLELSCPEAARLILSAHPREWICLDHPGAEKPDYDEAVMQILLESRQTALEFLEKNLYPLPQALAILLLYAHEVQAQIHGDRAAALDPAVCLSDATAFQGKGDVAVLLSFFMHLEILTDEWKTRLENPMDSIPWAQHLQGLARYLIERYWLQSISDYELVARVKFIIAACLLVNRLGDDPLRTAQLFSKEIENDPDNVAAILDGCYASPAFTDMNLLGLLLNTDQKTPQ